MDEFSNGYLIHAPLRVDVPPKPNLRLQFGEDTNMCIMSHSAKVPNAFQRWMLKVVFGINLTLVKEQNT